MAKKRIAPETNSILARLDSVLIMELDALMQKDPKALFALLEILKNIELNTILHLAGNSDSLDAILKSTGKQSFSRGKIAMAQLVKSLLENVESEINKRELKNK